MNYGWLQTNDAILKNVSLLIEWSFFIASPCIFLQIISISVHYVCWAYSTFTVSSAEEKNLP